MRFVCSFAWADLEIQPEERAFIADLMGRLELDAEDRLQVNRWLELPPRPEEIDPTRVPLEHRRLFVTSIKGVIAADGEITDEERSALELFKQLAANH
jgi:hypothetical protein